jgi:broad specificity phosphatase PhoE
MKGMTRILVVMMFIPVLGCRQGPEEPPPAEALRVYLARHGQTDWNAERRLQGNTDTELNETGRRQAAELAARLDGIDLDAIYSSQLRRSRDTAQVVAGERGVVSLAELNEQSLGEFEGAYLDGRDPQAVTEFERRSADPNDTMGGGESIEQHLARVEEALELIRGRHPSGQILIVGHGGTNAQILRALLGLTAEEAGEIRQSNSELYLIELSPGRDPRLWKLIPSERLDEL